MAELSYQRRKGLEKSQFAEPGERKYPIPDAAHARNAVARVCQHGSPEEVKRVLAAVRKKFPGIDVQGCSDNH